MKPWEAEHESQKFSHSIGKREVKQTCSSDVQSEFADRNPHPVHTEIAQPENPAAVRHYDDIDVVLRPSNSDP